MTNQEAQTLLTRLQADLHPNHEIEVTWICYYPEFEDPACHPYHVDPDPSAARQPRKHSACTWAVIVS